MPAGFRTTSRITLNFSRLECTADRHPNSTRLGTCSAPLQLDVGGTPQGVPFAGLWNASLWTLIFGVLCYVAVAGFGALGLLRRRWFIPATFALVLAWSALLRPPSAFADLTDSGRKVSVAWLLIESLTARLILMFLAGALLYQLRNRIPARWSLVAVSAGILAVSLWLPNYRLLGAIPLAYVIIASGALIRNHLRLRTDLSYGTYIYASPIQQLLIICGLVVNPVVFAIIAAAAVLPLAAASWLLVEKPALSLKSRLKRRGSAPHYQPAPA